MQGKQFQGVSYYHGQVKFYQTKLQVYVYAVDGMLVDSGPSRLQKEIAEFCEGQNLKGIVHTHFHEDHTGNTAYLMQKYQIPAYTNSTVQDICAVKGQIPIYRRIFWGPRPGFTAQPLPRFIDNGHSRLEVIPTPGHTQDHVVFLDEANGRLFTGDLFLHVKTRIIMGQENLSQVMESLRSLLTRNFETVFCSHAGVVQNGYQQIAKKLTYLEDLQDKLQTLRKAGMSYREINQVVFPQTPFITKISLGEWSSYHVVRSLLEDCG